MKKVFLAALLVVAYLAGFVNSAVVVRSVEAKPVSRWVSAATSIKEVEPNSSVSHLIPLIVPVGNSECAALVAKALSEAVNKSYSSALLESGLNGAVLAQIIEKAGDLKVNPMCGPVKVSDS